MRVLSIVGARPNFMKIAPLLEQMDAASVDAVLVHTGQHYDASMSDAFFQDLGIRPPDHYLGVGSGTHAQQTAQVMMALEPLCLELRPDVVLVVGDVNSTLAAALVASKLRIPLAHVEAGLRSYDRGMPEEINRVLTDAVSDFLFTTERSARENLRREGVPDERIHFVGNVMVDTLLRHRERAASLGMPDRLGLARRGYALVTLHRPSNVDVESVLSGIMDALGRLAEEAPVLFPAHPRTRQRMAALVGSPRGNGGDGTTVTTALSGVRIMQPMGYLEFLDLMANAGVVLTDSGGLQEETTALGVPCLTLRENTERPITVTEGTNRVVGTDPERIFSAARAILSPGNGAGGAGSAVGRCPELWDGHAAERIVTVLLERLGSGTGRNGGVRA